MNRRNYIKTIALGAIAPAFVPSAISSNLIDGWKQIKKTNFNSNWHNWPDMKWVGPEYWGNPLQDWELKNGKTICKVSQPNRNLHLLTLQKSPGLEALETSVTITPYNLDENISGSAGLRLGVKGTFEDYRSAAVFGKGLSIGVTRDYSLKINDGTIPTSLIAAPKSVKLFVKAIPVNKAYNLQISLIDPVTEKELFTDNSTTIQPEILEGGFALFSDYKKNKFSGKSVAFEDWKILGDRLYQNEEQLYGPICFAQYTLHNQKLKLTAQFAPLEDIEGHQIFLEFFKNGQWERETSTDLLEAGATFKTLGRAVNFSVEKWKYKKDVPYRIVAEIPLKNEIIRYEYDGTIAKEPLRKDEIKAAVFSCNFHYGFPDNDIVKNMKSLNPDIVLFLGDQFYEGTGGFGANYSASLEETSLDYLRKWFMFGWSYRELFRHKPCAIIPDDHDVYHGNVWGENGKKADTSEGFGAAAQDSGGYKMPAEWVNMIQYTQTSHLPDPFDSTPVNQGINVYYTHWNYGGISFAILEDRKFKSAPKHVLPEHAKVWNGFITNPDFDIKNHKNLEAELLGNRQHKFLEDWVENWENGAEMKAVLSQTNFATVATLPEHELTDQIVPSLSIPEKGEYVQGDEFTVDMDSNGWPSNKRDEAIKIIRKGFAFHIAGDQHLGSFIQYGVNDHKDSGFAFAGPALNNIWPRRFWPSVDTSNHTFEKPSYTGNHIDGFGNKISVLAVANPHKSEQKPKILSERATGYGLVTFNKEKRTIKTECWPRFVMPTKENQNPGWPITIAQQDNYARAAKAWLPEIDIISVSKPVVSIWNENDELVYSLRLKSKSFKPKVFTEGRYKIQISDPKNNKSQLLKNIKTTNRDQKTIKVKLT